MAAINTVMIAAQSKYCRKGDMEMRPPAKLKLFHKHPSTLTISVFVSALGYTFSNHIHLSEFGADHMRSYQFWVEPN